MPISVNIAVEDSLSEIVLRRLLRHRRRDLTIGVRYPLKSLAGGIANPANRRSQRGLSGYGQIKVQLPAFNAAAHEGQPFVVLTDLDVHTQCPGQLLPKWLPNVAPSPNLVFRVAVKEVEAWLVADRHNVATFLEVDLANLPTNAEALADPKMEIVRLARLSNSQAIYNDLVPSAGSTAQVGRGFERALRTFVEDHWNIDEAASCSRSLDKALRAIQNFNPQLNAMRSAGIDCQSAEGMERAGA